MKKDIIARRIERFFKIASLFCADCGEFASIYDENGNVIECLEDYGLYNKDDWDEEMDKEMAWIKENRKAVMAILPALEGEWSSSCNSLRTVLSLSNFSLN